MLGVTGDRLRDLSGWGGHTGRFTDMDPDADWTTDPEYGTVLDMDVTDADLRVTEGGTLWTPSEGFSVSLLLKPLTLINWNCLVSAENSWGAFRMHSDLNGAGYAGTDLAARFEPTEIPADTYVVGRWSIYTYTHDGVDGRFYRDQLLVSGPTAQVASLAWGGFNLAVATTAGYRLAMCRIYDRALNPSDIEMQTVELLGMLRPDRYRPELRVAVPGGGIWFGANL